MMPCELRKAGRLSAKGGAGAEIQCVSQKEKKKEEEGEDHFVLLPVRSLQEEGWLVVSYTDKRAMKLLTKQFYNTMTFTGEHSSGAGDADQSIPEHLFHG